MYGATLSEFYSKKQTTETLNNSLNLKLLFVHNFLSKNIYYLFMNINMQLIVIDGIQICF